MQKSKGFTLIELLIVVAIIAILAAIAVPNFLEAQIRSKVARVKSDHRVLATAIESYFVDHGEYIPNHNGPAQTVQGPNAGSNPSAYVFMTRLSTPIAYIANALLPDPFPSKYDTTGSGGGTYGYINTGRGDGLAFAVVEATALTEAQKSQIYSLGWLVSSQGPDMISRLQEIEIGLGGDPSNVSPQAFIDWLNETGSQAPAIYDPTNGTVSRGDISRTSKGVFEPRHVGL